MDTDRAHFDVLQGFGVTAVSTSSDLVSSNQFERCEPGFRPKTIKGREEVSK